MASSLELVRQAVTQDFKAFHETYFPDLLVNYENYVVVDIEHQTEPFVSLELKFDPSFSGLGMQDIDISGEMYAVYYYQQGKGGQGKLEYTDQLNSILGMKVSANGIYYREVVPTPVTTFPGWQGWMNRMKFFSQGTCQ